LSHAEAGGDEAREVLDYLVALGGAGAEGPSQPLEPEQRGKYAGVYAFGPTENERLEVYEKDGRMMIRRGAAEGGHRLTHLGDHVFRPAGAEAVRIRFSMAGERAGELEVHDPGLLLRARRVP
jgi:hypothetical protein